MSLSVIVFSQNDIYIYIGYQARCESERVLSAIR